MIDLASAGSALTTGPLRQRRSGSLSGFVVRLLLVLSTVGVFGLWWLETPSIGSLTPGTAITAAGELTGMVSGVLVCRFC